MSEFAWFVVQTHPKKEAFVNGRIEDLGREAFLPLFTEHRPRPSREVTAPLFPGYLFARLSATCGDLPRVRWTQGVKGLLGDTERPRSVPDHVVETIRARVNETGRIRVGRRASKGDRVRIVNGPLCGLVGLLDQPAANPNQRVWVLVELFQRLTRVGLRPDEIIKLGAA